MLEELLKKQVLVVTNDGRNYIGELIASDKHSNVVLKNCNERMFSLGVDGAAEAGSRLPSKIPLEPLGLYFIKGDNLCFIGLFDAEEDDKIDYSSYNYNPIKLVIH